MGSKREEGTQVIHCISPYDTGQPSQQREVLLRNSIPLTLRAYLCLSLLSQDLAEANMLLQILESLAVNKNIIYK